MSVMMLFFLITTTNGREVVLPRLPLQMATFKAHTILPETFRGVVKRNGKLLFQGLESGLAVPIGEIDQSRILREVDRITEMVNQRHHFREIVHQMGFVSGLLAVYSHPARDSRPAVQAGFAFYLNKKLNRCLFVFDGYPSWQPNRSWLEERLNQAGENRKHYRRLLEKYYGTVGDNSRYMFDETSPVFGVASIYFSNLARYSAHLWFYAWARANGDLTGTPFALSPPPPRQENGLRPHLRGGKQK